MGMNKNSAWVNILQIFFLEKIGKITIIIEIATAEGKTTGNWNATTS